MSDYFNSMISEKLKAYVYALADPRTLLPLKDRIFYVGKGNGNRCFSNAALAQEGQRQSLHEREHKLSMIRRSKVPGTRLRCSSFHMGWRMTKPLRWKLLLFLWLVKQMQ